MKKLTFVNALNQSIVFSKTSKYKWLNVDDLGGNTASFQTISSPFQDGVTVVGLPYFNSKLIKLDFIILANDVIAEVRELNAKLNPKLGMSKLIYEQNGDKKVLDKVKVRMLPTLSDKRMNGKKFQQTSIIFEVFNPLFTDLEITEELASVGQMLLQFPWELKESGFELDVLFEDGAIIENFGDVETPIEVIINGPVLAPLEVENTVSNKKIVVTLDLTANEKLVITTDIENTNVVLTNLDTGISTSAFNYIDILETEFFMLELGTNIIKVTGLEGTITDVLIRYKNRYVGV